jgi:adenosine deaminase
MTTNTQKTPPPADRVGGDSESQAGKSATIGNGRIPEALLAELPKTDLHCHLDGSLRLESLIELAQDRNVKLPSYTAEGLRELVFKPHYRDLPDYLHGFAYTCAVLTDAEALERAAYELGADCLAEGVCYLEVRFAPHLHARPDLPVSAVLQAVDRGLDRIRREYEKTPEVQDGSRPPFRYGIITCAMRMFTAGFAPYFRDLLSVLGTWPVKDVYGAASLSLARAVVDARDRLGLPVVGFDLAGAEAGHPASDHREAYQYCHSHFLKKTVHAGEAYGPESIFQAITKLHADRIGHGTHLYDAVMVQSDEDDPHRYVRQLSQYIADRRILLEVCITSNMQTMPELRRVEEHPFGRMVEDRLSVSLCTDNRLVSDTTVTRELQLATDAFHINAAELRRVILHGFKRSFYPGSYRDKRNYVRQVIDVYDRVAAKHGLPAVDRAQHS